jgi:hypothetical protein
MAKLLIVFEAKIEVECNDKLLKEFEDGTIEADVFAFNADGSIMSKISEASYVSMIFKGKDRDLIYAKDEQSA